jgi:hypothetical protein
VADNGNAWNIGRRFRDELEYIERYVRLLRVKSTLHDRQVQDLNAILKRVQVDPLPIRHYDRAGKPYSADEIAKLLGAIRLVDPEVYQTILGHEQQFDDIPSFQMDGPAAEYMDRLPEWVDYLMERLSDDPEDDEVENVLRSAMDESATVDQELDEEERIPPEALRALLASAVEHAMHAQIHQRVDAMVYVRQQFEEIEVLARVAMPDAEINILRQGFVLLMTAFDAAIFDLTRIGFRRKFFDLIGAFGKGERVTLESIGEAGSFEAFRDQLIEEQLKKRYVKDLLSLLQALGVQCVNETAGDRPVQLVELVLRRNLHVHNRGVVDERYLESDSMSGKPKYNLYNLKLGDAATIDDSYFQTAIRLCGNCVERVVGWSDESAP